MSTALVTIHNNLNKLLDDKQKAMPKNFNKTRFLQNSMTVLQDTKDIEKCDAQSVARCMLKGAFLGLDFFNKECYAISYGGQISFQTDYKGEKKLAKMYSVRPIKDIYAKNVREGDDFLEEVKDGEQTIQFKPLNFNSAKILGSFAVVLYVDGGMDYETMSIGDIEDTRKNYSKQANGQAWTKNIELNFDTIEQKEAFEDGGDLDLKKDRVIEQQSPLDERNVVDAEFEEIADAIN
jgi:recombination protein RecT